MKYFYLCDKKPGACSGWEKGWTKCENLACSHTTDRSHAKNKKNRYFDVYDNGECWERRKNDY